MKHHAPRRAGKRYTACTLSLVFIIGLCASVASCQKSEVKSFAWYDAQGSRLRFTGSYQGGSEAGFSAKGEKKRFSLESPTPIPDGYALRLRFSSLGEGTQFQVSYGDGRGKGSSLLCAIPSAGSFAFLIPAPASRTLTWIEIKAVALQEAAAPQTGDSKATVYPLTLQEIRSVPEMRGFSIDGDTTEISPQFSQSPRSGGREYRIEEPFAGLSQTAYGAAQLDIALSGAASNVELLWGGQNILYQHRGGAATFSVPCALLEKNPSSLVLVAPASLRVERFSVGLERKAGELDRIDPGLLVQSAPMDAASGAPLYIARWDMRPDTLLFLFKDYATQDKYLKRLAFFVEKIGYVGRLAPDSEIADLHGWNAHDYRPEDLARFFETAQEQRFPLSGEELSLRDMLVASGIIIARGNNFSPGKGAIVSISQESATYLQYRFLSHELSHALFFTDSRYRDLVLSLYQRLTEDQKWFIVRYFRWMRYNVDSSYLMANEMQAYLVQQSLNDIQKYFVETLGANLAKAHPELTERIDTYMRQELPALIENARQLGAYLRASYGLEPGMLYRIK